MANARQFMAARTAAWAKSGGWVNPYVTDGLVAMWDGEWNAGGGVHDPNATVWKDICGNEDGTMHNCTVLSNALYFNGSTSYVQLEDGQLYASRSLTIQCCIALDEQSTRSGQIVFYGGKDSQRQLSVGLDCNAVITHLAINGSSGSVFDGWGRASKELITVIFADSMFATSAFKGDMNLPRSGHDDAFALNGDSPQIGRRNNGVYMIGKVYCIRVYDRAITTAEISANYAVDKARFDLP